MAIRRLQQMGRLALKPKQCSVKSVNWIAVFLRGAGAFLLFVGVSKIVLVTTHPSQYSSGDPITGLSLRSLLYLIGTSELVLGAWLCFTRQWYNGCALLTIFCGALLCYRFIGYIGNVTAPCPCLGFVGHLLPKSLANTLPPILALVMFLIAISYTQVHRYDRCTNSLGTK